MSLDPIFITRVSVAKGPDFAMIAMGAPVGPLKDGPVEHTDILRVVMSYRTLKEVAELFTRTVREFEAVAAAAAQLSTPQPTPLPATVIQTPAPASRQALIGQPAGCEDTLDADALSTPIAPSTTH